MLVVDDDEALRGQLTRAFERRGYAVMPAANFDEAQALVRATAPQLAVVDLKMPGGSGMDVLRMLRELAPDCRSVVLTGFGSIANAVQAMRLGAVNYVTKPADVEQVLQALSSNSDWLPTVDPDELKTASLAEVEWNHIQKVLADCDGNVTRAARALDIPRRTLQRKLKKLAP
jgi:two-component system response regulator RegA